jgi:hypothetical protein
MMSSVCISMALVAPDSSIGNRSSSMGAAKAQILVLHFCAKRPALVMNDVRVHAFTRLGATRCFFTYINTANVCAILPLRSKQSVKQPHT